MSILKAILHHWNKTNKEYDILHPQTDSSMVTDWNAGIVNTLASTALGSLISTLSSDSLAAKIVKLVLDATGVKYLIDTKGYVCFGSLFGGLIIQWGITVNEVSTGILQWKYPIAVNQVCRNCHVFSTLFYPCGRISFCCFILQTWFTAIGYFHCKIPVLTSLTVIPHCLFPNQY